MLNSWHILYLRSTGIRKAVCGLYERFWERADSYLANLLHFPAINVSVRERSIGVYRYRRLKATFSKRLGKK